MSDKGGREGQLAVRTRFQAPQVRVSARPSRGAAARPVEPGRGDAGARGEDAGRGMQGLGAVPPPAPESEESAAHRCFSSLPVESGRQAARALPGSVGRNQGSWAAAVVAAWGQAPQCILFGKCPRTGERPWVCNECAPFFCCICSYRVFSFWLWVHDLHRIQLLEGPPTWFSALQLLS